MWLGGVGDGEILEPEELTLLEQKPPVTLRLDVLALLLPFSCLCCHSDSRLSVLQRDRASLFILPSSSSSQSLLVLTVVNVHVQSCLLLPSSSSLLVLSVVQFQSLSFLPSPVALSPKSHRALLPPASPVGHPLLAVAVICSFTATLVGAAVTLLVKKTKTSEATEEKNHIVGRFTLKSVQKLIVCKSQKRMIAKASESFERGAPKSIVCKRLHLCSMNGVRIILRVLHRKRPRLFLCFSTSPSSDPLLFPPSYDLSSCISFLQACAHHGNLSKGKQLHSYLLKNGFLDSPLSITSLINMYSKCGLMNHALKVFNYPTPDDKNVFAYNAIIAGFIANGFAEDGFEIYKEMRWVGIVPDKFTFPCVIRSCGDAMDTLEVKKIHGLLFKLGLELDVFVGSALVNNYLKFGLMMEAQEVFDELTIKDVVLWNSMVNGYAQIGRFDEAMEVFRLMAINRVVPSTFTVTGILSIFSMTGDFDSGRAVHGFVVKMGYGSNTAVANALIDMYGKCICLIDSLNIFESMDEKDIFSWNSILSIQEHCGDHYGTLKHFKRMLGEMVKPDLVTTTIVLPVCSHLAALVHGREIHGYMIVNGFGRAESLVDNALMDMYAKCGDMRYARMVFDNMREKDLASWNIMIMGYGMYGYGNEALEFFSRMCQAQLAPDEITFVNLLSACSHAGLVKEGQELLAEMESKYGVSPTIEHYTCVIDMLGRAGQLKEAYDLVLTMPIEVNPIGWRALLSACHLHKNTDLAKIAAKKVIELEPGHSGNYVLMSNVFGVAGQFEEVSEVRYTMRQESVKKTPGYSWIELTNGVHFFITGDRNHSHTNFIYACLNSLIALLQEQGYVPLI